MLVFQYLAFSIQTMRKKTSFWIVFRKPNDHFLQHAAEFTAYWWHKWLTNIPEHHLHVGRDSHIVLSSNKRSAYAMIWVGISLLLYAKASDMTLRKQWWLTGVLKMNAGKTWCLIFTIGWMQENATDRIHVRNQRTAIIRIKSFTVWNMAALLEHGN